MKKPTKLQYYRKFVNGFTVNELSAITGITVSSINKYETGVMDLNNASITIVKRLARALNCTTDDLTDSLDDIDKGLNSYDKNSNNKAKT